MCFQSRHSHLHDGNSHHHHHGGDDGGATTTVSPDHGCGATGWAATHGALLGDGTAALSAGSLDIGGPHVAPLDPHAAGSVSDGHGLTALIAGNVNNGGIQINVIEVEYTTASHAVPVH